MERAQIMGIVNVTPDSFSDGGEFLDPERAIAHGRELAARAPTSSTSAARSPAPGRRPSAPTRSSAGSCRWSRPWRPTGRRSRSTPPRPLVAEAALDAGATMVNDVTALRAEPELAGLCAERDCEVVLMHMLGDPRTMQENPATTTSSTTSRHSSPSGSSSRPPRASTGTGSGSIPASASARPSSTTSSSTAGSASSPNWAGRSPSAPRARASSASSPAPTLTSGSAGRSPRT